MKVLVVFEFDGIENPDSPEADAKVQAITESCETMQVAFDANACWVQEVFGADSEDDDTYDEFGVNTKNSFNTPPKESK